MYNHLNTVRLFLSVCISFLGFLSNKRMWSTWLFLFFKGLPEPKAFSTESIPDKIQKQEDELEDEVKPKLSQIKDAPKPPQQRARVRITIPALQDVSSRIRVQCVIWCWKSPDIALLQWWLINLGQKELYLYKCSVTLITIFQGSL